MKRKDFLSTIVPFGATLGSMARGKTIIEEPDKPILVPPYLKISLESLAAAS